MNLNPPMRHEGIIGVVVQNFKLLLFLLRRKSYTECEDPPISGYMRQSIVQDTSLSFCHE